MTALVGREVKSECLSIGTALALFALTQADDTAGEDGTDRRMPLGRGHAVGMERVREIHGLLTMLMRWRSADHAQREA